MPELSEVDERAIRQYVETQSPADDPVTLVQQVGSRRILGQVHDLYDVHCASTRWWVITSPTNLYQQSDFPEVEQALIFHIGLGVVMAERSRGEMEDPVEQEQVTGSWRRFRQALEAMDDAHESEDFQAVGVKCRDALISLAKDHASDEWVGEVSEPPKAADFKGWANLFADRLTEAGRLRSYLKASIDKTWDLTVWLQHNSGATAIDADIVLGSTGHLISTLAKLIRRHEYGEPGRCPDCESYRVEESIERDDDKEGMWAWDECGILRLEIRAGLHLMARPFRGDCPSRVPIVRRHGDLRSTPPREAPITTVRYRGRSLRIGYARLNRAPSALSI